MSSIRHSSLGRRIPGGALVTAVACLGASAIAQEALTGNAARGEQYFNDGYKCYACHNFDAVSGARRLVPMRYTQDGFITFVQNSPLPQMPAYNDMPAQALADVYAYIQTLPDDAPEVGELDLLSDIRERKLDAIGN